MTMSAAAFLPGLVLSRILYDEEVRPILDDVFPGLRHTAACVGQGSEVLGYDTASSTVHAWGPRLELFLTPADAATLGPRVAAALASNLPHDVRGWPTHTPTGTRITVTDAGSWLVASLGCDPTVAEPTTYDWLAMPQQKLAEVTGGAVFHDGLGALGTARRRLAWYPDQVWRYLLACQWQRVARSEVFPGRCAEVGDDLGAGLAAGRLVRDLMRLCLLLTRRYAPYDKWLGSAFAALPVAARLTPSLRGALAARDHSSREVHLCDAYETVAELHNAVGLTEPVDPTRRPGNRRPFLILRAGRFAAALARTLTDPVLCATPPTGSVDQWADGTDFLMRTEPVRAATAALVPWQPVAGQPPRD
jgi:Domain of unknown function (DUF4037)